jgi:hypothetical protein
MANQTIVIKDFGTQTIRVTVEGTAPLIVNKWDAKIREQMVSDRVGGAPAPKKPIIDPTAKYEATIYRLEDGTPGFPATAFKLASVRGAQAFGMKMTEFRPQVLIHGEGADQLVRIKGEPKMREDIVRVGGKGKGTGLPDIRWRAEFWPWSAELTVTFTSVSLSAEQIVNCINAGGMNGIGEWRPEKDGTFGTYRVVGAEVAS